MAAPIWRIQINKEGMGEAWANDYLTADATIEDAQDLAALLLTWEQNIHQSNINFAYIRISSFLTGDRFFRHLTVNQPGLLAPADALPLFNTMRVDLGTANSDPARKYYRCPVEEVNQTNGLFNGAFLLAMAGLITTYLVTPGVLPHIVTNSGNPVDRATVQPMVQMRQLHRRRKKKVLP